MCKLNDEYKGAESRSPTEECKNACNQVSSCIGIGTHYFCDRLYFSSYDEGLAQAPVGMCKEWHYIENSGPIECTDIENDECGTSTPTNGCWVRT